MEPDSQPDEPDDDYYIQIRNDLLDIIKILGIGVAIDPFSAPEKARDQIPMLTGLASGLLDKGAVGRVGADDHGALTQWLSGYHHGVSTEQADTTRGAYLVLGVAAFRLHLLWALYSSLSRHHPYARVVAHLIQAAAQLSSIASTDLDPGDENDIDFVIEQHDASQCLLQQTLDALANAGRQLREARDRTQP